MIVDPDFPDHWKTRLLVDSLDGDEVAPIYVIRLWAHCQHRRMNAFQNITAAALKALCRYPGHPNKLEAGLMASGFVRREDGVLIVHEWDSYNASLIASWNNGSRGGRPPKNQPITHGLPTDNPEGTDKRREEQIPKHTHSHARPASVSEALEYAKGKAGYAPEIVRHWFSQRDSQNWQKGNAHPVTNWRSDLDAWVLNQRNHQPNGQKPRRTESDRDRENTGLNENIKIKEL